MMRSYVILVFAVSAAVFARGGSPADVQRVLTKLDDYVGRLNNMGELVDSGQLIDEIASVLDDALAEAGLPRRRMGD